MVLPAHIAKRLALILVFALGLRLLAAVAVETIVSRTPGRLDLIEGDANGYWELAARLRSGRPFEIYDPPRRVMRMPGFPMLLAVFQAVTNDSRLGVRVGLALVGVLGCGLVFVLGRQLANDNIGLIAAFLTALAPANVGFSPLFLSETAFGTALTASLVAAVALVRSVSPVLSQSPSRQTLAKVVVLGIAAGLLAGVATHMRPTWLPVGPVIALCAVWWGRARLPALVGAIALIVGLGLTIVPWGLRNQQVCGHFVPTTLWMGASLYDGLRPGANGASDMTFIETDGVLQRFSEYDADRHYRDLAWRFVSENPRRFVELCVIKLARYLSPWPNTEQFQQPLVLVLFSIWTVGVFALAIHGAARHRHEVLLLMATALPLMYFAAVHTLFVGSLRYRLPAEGPVMVLTALGLSDLSRIFRRDPSAEPSLRGGA